MRSKNPLRTTLPAVILLLALSACDLQGPPTVPPATSQRTPTTRELQATVEALQTVVAGSTPVEQPPAPEPTAEVVAEPTSEPASEGTPESTTEATGEAAEEQPTGTPVSLPAGQQVVLAGHPRLLVRPEDLSRLRSWAVESNPFYQNGLLPVIEKAKADMDSGVIFVQQDNGDNGGTAYTDYPNEMFAELFAFA